MEAFALKGLSKSAAKKTVIFITISFKKRLVNSTYIFLGDNRYESDLFTGRLVACRLFIVLSFVAYSAAGLAALEPRRSLPGQLVQWLCTGWGSREALLQGPLKILGALLMLPFTASDA